MKEFINLIHSDHSFLIKRDLGECSQVVPEDQGCSCGRGGISHKT